jgi:hypothetical protein
MKLERLLLFAVCLVQPGCGFFCYSIENLVEAPLNAKDECVIRQRFYDMADEAWKQARAADRSLSYSIHYVHGFKDGYAGYLDNGSPVPPAEPPWIYRTSHFETPEGIRAIHDWFAGYRHGAQVAQASGYRETAVILPLGQAPHQPPVPVAAPETGSQQGNSPVGEELPSPRKVLPSTRD